VVKVFYFSGDSLCGKLRAVLYDGLYFIRLASSRAFTYLGDRFPQMAIGDAPATVIEILPDTRETGWRPGFYLAEQPPLQLEQTLRAVRGLAIRVQNLRALINRGYSWKSTDGAPKDQRLRWLLGA
jgi:hypothetical protein